MSGSICLHGSLGSGGVRSGRCAMNLQRRRRAGEGTAHLPQAEDPEEAEEAGTNETAD